MDNDTLTNYLNNIRLSNAEKKLLTNINNCILIKYNNNPISFTDDINSIEDIVNMANPNMSERKQLVIYNFFRTVRKHTSNINFQNEVKNYYDEFEF